MIVFLSKIITIIMLTTNEPWKNKTNKVDQHLPIINQNTFFCFLWGLPKWLMAVKNKTVGQSSHVLERSTYTKDYCAYTNEYHLICIHMSRYLKFSKYCPNTSFACNICHNFKLKRKQGKKRITQSNMPISTSPGRCLDSTRNKPCTTAKLLQAATANSVSTPFTRNTTIANNF